MTDDSDTEIIRYGLVTTPGSPMCVILEAIERFSGGDYPVLISGESGTGKELVARAIHAAGPRRSKPFVVVDCAALVPTLIESELFGHVRGAFTGAAAAREGLLQSADSGTIFLDEIGELPIRLQAKLLRAIQEREVRLVGASRLAKLNARVLAASNRNLRHAVEKREFRRDLYYRLDVVPIAVPPLREHKQDVPALTRHFVRKYAAAPDRALSEDALKWLTVYDWPGNVRELENAIQHALAVASGPVIHLRDLPQFIQRQPVPHEMAVQEIRMTLREMDRIAILRAVEQMGGDKVRAAKLLGIGKTTLYRRLKEIGST